MTLLNSTAATSSGEALGTYTTPDGKEVQAFVQIDDSGHVVQTLPTYSFYIKAQAGAAAKVHWDLFNGVGSGKIIELRGLWCSPSLIASVTGLNSEDFDLYRTSTAGTGGTVMPYKSATFPNLSPMDTANAALPATITMRAAPATTAPTLAEALFTTYITQEETQAGAQLQQMYNVMPETAVGQRYSAREGQGFALKQITLGVAQNYSFFGLFTIV